MDQPQNNKPDNTNAEPTTPSMQNNDASEAAATSSNASPATGIVSVVSAGHFNLISLFCAVNALVACWAG